MKLLSTLFVVCLCAGAVPQASAAKISKTELKQKRMEFNGEKAIEIRSATSVAQRCLALVAVTTHAYDPSGTRIISWVEKHQIAAYFSDGERIAFSKSELTQQERSEFSWRAEAMVSLLWALGIIEKFPTLNEQYDLYQNQAVKDLIANPEKFLTNAKLRSTKEIEEMEGQLYHEHWRVRDAQLFGKPMPSELDPEIVYERRYGLSWVVGWGDSWDEVPTDT